MASLVMSAHDSAHIHHFPTMVSPSSNAASQPSSATATPSRPSRPSTGSRISSTSRPASTAQTARSEAPNTPQHARPAPPAVSPADASASASPASSRATHSTTASSTTSPTSPPRIKIRDLRHIQSFCADASSPMAYLQPDAQSANPRQQDGDAQAPQYEISGMPVADVIEMVAGLLTKITTTNDGQAEQLHRNIPTGPEAAAGMSPQTSSVLAFHGKNVPTISIMSYLSRIHKYCPATYEVFLSLLVYFDRITDKINSSPALAAQRAEGTTNAEAAQTEQASATPTQDRPTSSSLPSPPLSEFDPMNLAHFFVVDSYNIHRLVIAGVTCASKFFSDVFYTNSRYAKVGGLPLVELNHLELQFLILNDFRLSIPVEELEAYATMLVEFYAREVLAQRQDERMEGVESTS